GTARVRGAVRYRRGRVGGRAVADIHHSGERGVGRRSPGGAQVGGPPVIEVGDVAPDFTLRNQNNEEVTLSGFRGRRAVLVIFYPLAFTGICTGELCAVRDDLA